MSIRQVVEHLLLHSAIPRYKAMVIFGDLEALLLHGCWIRMPRVGRPCHGPSFMVPQRWRRCWFVRLPKCNKAKAWMDYNYSPGTPKWIKRLEIFFLGGGTNNIWWWISFKPLQCGCNMLKDDFQWFCSSRLWGITRAFRRDHQENHVGMRFWVTLGASGEDFELGGQLSRKGRQVGHRLGVEKKVADKKGVSLNGGIPKMIQNDHF